MVLIFRWNPVPASVRIRVEFGQHRRLVRRAAFADQIGTPHPDRNRTAHHHMADHVERPCGGQGPSDEASHKIGRITGSIPVAAAAERDGGSAVAGEVPPHRHRALHVDDVVPVLHRHHIKSGGRAEWLPLNVKPPDVFVRYPRGPRGRRIPGRARRRIPAFHRRALPRAKTISLFQLIPAPSFWFHRAVGKAHLRIDGPPPLRDAKAKGGVSAPPFYGISFPSPRRRPASAPGKRSKRSCDVQVDRPDMRSPSIKQRKFPCLSPISCDLHRRSLAYRLILLFKNPFRFRVQASPRLLSFG